MKEKERDTKKNIGLIISYKESICVQEIIMVFYFLQLDNDQNLFYVYESLQNILIPGILTLCRNHQSVMNGHYFKKT